MKYSTTRKLTALAAGMALASIAGSASAFNLGEVWVGDQENGNVYIADQSALNNPFIDAPVTTVDLNAAAGGKDPETGLCQGDSLHASARCADRMHIIGFSNHAGLDPASRAIFGYLDGVAEIWASNGGTHVPTKITELQVLGGLSGGANSLHMCGGDPTNTKLACSSIGGRKVITYSADMATDTYTRLGDWSLNTTALDISKRVKGQAKKEVQAQMDAINAAHANPQAICNNFDTTGNTLYVTVGTSAISGGVIVLDVTDPANPAIVDAWATPNADGCGLVNSQDGNYMWINHGHNSADDIEKVTKWDNNNYLGSKIDTVGPVAEVILPRAEATPNGRNGDVHGAQFAGLGGLYLWEIMRVDDLIHVVDPNTAEVVNTINLSIEMAIDAPQPDVLDRSALGSKMYFSTRGFIPTTAITGFIDLDRDPGIVTMSTLFGHGGRFMKTTSIRTGETTWLCHSDDDGGDHDHEAPLVCPDQDPAIDPETKLPIDTVDNEYIGEVDTVDPHGLKSLQYLTGGF